MKNAIILLSILGVGGGGIPAVGQNAPAVGAKAVPGQTGAAAPVQKAPILPRDMEPAEFDALTKSAYGLSAGQFDQALALLKPLSRPAVIKVLVDWIPVPKAERPAYKQAIQEAFQAWSPAYKFALVENEDLADVIVQFEREVMRTNNGQTMQACSDPRIDPSETGRRLARVRVAVSLPYTDSPHPAASIVHSVAQGLGFYLGLPLEDQPGGLMGPDTHTPDLALRPTATDVQRLAQIHQVYAKLLDFAQRRVAIYVPKPVITADKLEMDAGEVWRGTDAQYLFTIKNTGDAPLEIEAKPNCGCTVAKYDKVIAPGATGQIQAELHTAAYRGRLLKRIDVKSNDPAKPMISLSLTANVKSILTVAPVETPIVGLRDSGDTVHDFQIKVDSMDPVEVTRATCSVPYATASVTRGPDSPTGRVYDVKVSVEPAAPMGRSAFMVTAFTSSVREPQLNITMIAEKGIIAMPPSAYMGAISQTTVLPVNQILSVSKKFGSFHVLKVETDDNRLQVTPQTIKDGSEYRLMLTYKGGWPIGQVRSKVTVLTDDPAQSRIEIPVIATVLATGASR